MRYTFGAYTLDTQRYELCHGGISLQLQPKVCDLLAHLLQHRDRVVTRQGTLRCAVAWALCQR